MSDKPEPLFTSPEPFDADRVHTLAIYCSDGRYGEQFDDFLQQYLKLPGYDRLAVPGGPACLAGHHATANSFAGIRDQIRFLIEAHGLRTVVLIQHHGCAFYAAALPDATPESMKPEQDNDLLAAKAQVRRMSPGIKVITVYARLTGTTVSFEPVFLDD
jgi:hypothetical protein